MIHWIQPEDVARARERWKPFFEKLAASPMSVQLRKELYESPLWMSMNLGVHYVANPLYEMATEIRYLSGEMMQYPQLRGLLSVLTPLYSVVGMNPREIKVIASAPSYIMPTPAEQYTAHLGPFRLTESMLAGPPAFGFLRNEREHARVEGAGPIIERFAGENNDIGRLQSYLGQVVAPSTAAGAVALWGHEAAHHLLQLADTDITEPLRQLSASNASVEQVMQSVFRTAARAAFISEWLHEGISDAFGTALSLDAYSMVRNRYAGAVYDRLRYSLATEGDIPQHLKHWRYGDPVEVPVVPAWMIESERSPVFQKLVGMLYEYYRRPPQAGDDISVRAGVDQMRYLVTSALSNRSPDDLSWRRQFVGVLGSLVNSLKSGPRTQAWDDPGKHIADASDMDEVSAFVWTSLGTRAWVVPYWVGKARPDLVGKHLEYRPDSITVKETGERIDISAVLPDLKPIAPSPDTPILPIAMERGIKATEVYRRMRKAIARGVQLNENTGETVDANLARWQERFQRIMETEELAE